MADKKKMSVEEILAAARKSDSPAGSASPPAAKESAAPEPAAEAPAESAAPAKPAAAKPAAAKPAAGGKPGAMSVADILAAARGEGKAAAAAPAPAAPKPAAKAAAPKAPAAKPTAEKPAAEKTAATTSAAKDTASILAAARAAAKPGPISKSELAARGKEVETGKKKPVAPPMPDKPAYAQPRPAAAPTTATGRRGFMQTVGAGVLAASAGSALALGFSSLAVTFNLWVLGFARFMFPNILTEPPTKFKVGFPNELAQGQVQTKFVPQFGVWIVRHEYDGAAQIYALQTVCTHLGCTPNWLEGEQKFKCPCHGSGFYKDGVNFEGPAPRPLERFAIRLADDGQLEVDKSRKFKEELGQWRDTASFVPV